MKIRLLLLPLIVALLAPLFLYAQAPRSEDEPETELGAKMEQVNRAFRVLRRSAGDASKNADSLQLVATIRENAEAAVKLEPVKAVDVPEADREKFIASYRSEMKKMLEHLDGLEAALRANNNAQAAAIVSAISDQQKAAHKEYRRPPAKK